MHSKRVSIGRVRSLPAQVFAQDPTQVSVLNNKAAVFMEMKDYDAAIQQCADAVDKARELRPTPFEVIAKIYVRWGKIFAKQKVGASN